VLDEGMLEKSVSILSEKISTPENNLPVKKSNIDLSILSPVLPFLKDKVNGRDWDPVGIVGVVVTRVHTRHPRLGSEQQGPVNNMYST
jgi:hypothetical protein